MKKTATRLAVVVAIILSFLLGRETEPTVMRVRMLGYQLKTMENHLRVMEKQFFELELQTELCRSGVQYTTYKF